MTDLFSNATLKITVLPNTSSIFNCYFMSVCVETTADTFSPIVKIRASNLTKNELTWWLVCEKNGSTIDVLS